MTTAINTTPDSTAATTGDGSGGSPLSGTQTVYQGQGSVAQGNGGSTHPNPYTLTGTQIGDLSTNALALSARVHRKASDQFNLCELWFWRDTAWHLFPNGPYMDAQRAPSLAWTYRQPSTLTFTCQNQQGEFTPENLASSWNLNTAGNYDPLFDEARKVLLRVGIRCYSNLAAGIVPTTTQAIAAGSLSALTDGTLQDYTQALSNYAKWIPASLAAFDIALDLGSVQQLRHTVVRFGTRLGTYQLPASVQVLFSVDNVTFTSLLPQPVGGVGGGDVPPGDWDDDVSGRGIEIAKCDIECPARYIVFRVLPAASAPIVVDEIAVYGGGQGSLLGANLFVGYLGDDIDINTAGEITCVATDSMKRLADNNEAALTAAYTNAEAGDIVHSLLTGSTYWPDHGPYSAPFEETEIGWSNGSGLTGLVYPVWQGQTNNMLGYPMELFHSLGWMFYSDGNGVWQALDPPYAQRLPDRVFTNADDANRDVRKNVRKRTGKEMRNLADVRCGATQDGQSGSNIKFEPNSVAKYGPRRTVITDPLLSSDQLREKVGTYLVRDYAFRLKQLRNEIQPDFDTRLRDIHAFRATYRPKLYAKGSTVTGWKRLSELWYLNSLTSRLTVSDWSGDAEYRPYFPAILDPPLVTKLDAPSSVSYIRLSYSPQPGWNFFTQPASIRVYVSTVGELGPFTFNGLASVLVGPGTYDITATAGTRYWAYMTSVDADGYESLPSEIVTCLAGSGAPDNLDGWTVTDFSASLSQSSGPDSQGYYTYAFYCLWTAPSPKGYKRMTIRMSYNALPTVNPDYWSSWPLQNNSWNEGNGGQIVPPGLMWDRVNAGQLNWECRLRTKTQLMSGSHMYLKMWTSSTNLGFHPSHPGGWYGYPSNVATVAI